MGNTCRLGFRGDKRHPIEDGIFDNGLNARLTDAPILYRGPTCDTNNKSAVCFTWRLDTACYFPLQAEEEITYIYVLNIDLSQAAKDDIFQSRLKFLNSPKNEMFNETKSNISNIHGTQYLDSLIFKYTYKPAEASNYLFADEMAAKKIPAKDILFAVKCVRQFNNPKDLKKGVTYQLVGSIIDNRNFVPGDLSPEMITKARELINTEIQLSAVNKIDAPLIESGFQKNDTVSGHKKIFKHR